MTPGDVYPVSVRPDEIPEKVVNSIERMPVRIASTTPSEQVLMTEHTEITFEEDERADFGEWWTGLKKDIGSELWPDIDESNTVGIDPEEIPADAIVENVKQIVEKKLDSDD